MNITCPQLTEGLKHIQKLKAKCDEVLSGAAANKIKLDRLIDFKTAAEELMNQRVDVEGCGEIIIYDYGCILEFIKTNQLKDKDNIEFKEKIILGIMVSNGEVASVDLNNLWAINMRYVRSIKALSKLKSLVELGLENQHRIKDFNYLSLLKHLKKLNLRGTGFNDLKILEELEELEYLNIEYCSGRPDLRPLLSCKKLLELKMNKIGNGPADFTVMEECYNVIDVLKARGTKIKFL